MQACVAALRKSGALPQHRQPQEPFRQQAASPRASDHRGPIRFLESSAQQEQADGAGEVLPPEGGGLEGRDGSVLTAMAREQGGPLQAGARASARPASAGALAQQQQQLAEGGISPPGLAAGHQRGAAVPAHLNYRPFLEDAAADVQHVHRARTVTPKRKRSMVAAAHGQQPHSIVGRTASPPQSQQQQQRPSAVSKAAADFQPGCIQSADSRQRAADPPGRESMVHFAGSTGDPAPHSAAQQPMQHGELDNEPEDPPRAASSLPKQQQAQHSCVPLEISHISPRQHKAPASEHDDELYDPISERDSAGEGSAPNRAAHALYSNHLQTNFLCFMTNPILWVAMQVC